MSYINSESLETIKTRATMKELKQVLLADGYKIIETSMQITATNSWGWGANRSTITIVDEIDYRFLTNKQVSTGLMIRPKEGMLAELVSKAERLSKNCD